MAKQTFTTGQVLLASQLTSLQQTALGGGAASAKVASYTLVAADAGTAISMTNASATTITVNTGLFSAGDTVLLQNLGAGVCTVTAGSATVNTAGSLALSQYEAGVLYFVSSSAAVLFDYTQTAAASPLTTKGDIYTRNSSADARLPVGTNGQVLTADSSEATGLKFATPSAGSLTFISSTNLGSSVSVSGCFTSTYINYLLLVYITAATSNADVNLRLRAGSTDTTSNYVMRGDISTVSAEFKLLQDSNSAGQAVVQLSGPQIADATLGTFLASGLNIGVAYNGFRSTGALQDATQYDGFTLYSAATLTGTVKVYGYSN